MENGIEAGRKAADTGRVGLRQEKGGGLRKSGVEAGRDGHRKGVVDAGRKVVDTRRVGYRDGEGGT